MKAIESFGFAACRYIDSSMFLYNLYLVRAKTYKDI